MRFKSRMILGFFVWAGFMLLGSPFQLNQEPWFAVLTVTFSMVIVFFGDKILRKLQGRNPIEPDESIDLP